jgi:hypothetical protein
MRVTATVADAARLKTTIKPAHTANARRRIDLAVRAGAVGSQRLVCNGVIGGVLCMILLFPFDCIPGPLARRDRDIHY